MCKSMRAAAPAPVPTNTELLQIERGLFEYEEQTTATILGIRRISPKTAVSKIGGRGMRESACSFHNACDRTIHVTFMTSPTRTLIGQLTRTKNLRNSVEDFVQGKKMRGVVHAQIDFRIGLLSSSPSIVLAKAL